MRCRNSSARWSSSTTSHSRRGLKRNSAVGRAGMIRDVRRVGAATGLLALALVTAAAAQDFNWFRGGRFRGPDPRVPTATSFDGYFNFCRGMYYSNRREPGGQGWWTDYP